MASTKKTTDSPGSTTKQRRMPEAATTVEKSAIDDQAISEAVTAEEGTKSVLPGPPIPPEVQTEIRQQRQGSEPPGSPARTQKGGNSMIDPNDIREHMEVVGSDGEHVGTVDHCEGPNIIKLTKSDPAAGGEHHYIPLAWVDRIDQRVHLAHPGNDARARWG
jgi:hypothetical protein